MPLTAIAQWRDFEADFDEGRKAWKEIEAQIPAYPRPENLILFETAPAGHQFYVDAPSVSVGDDGVVRYTLFVKTAGGEMRDPQPRQGVFRRAAIALGRTGHESQMRVAAHQHDVPG